MSAQIKDGGPVDVLADLQGVVRIAKAASLGVTGNKPRIERAEQAIAAVAELVEADREYDASYAAVGELRDGVSTIGEVVHAEAALRRAHSRRATALARVGSAK